LSGKIKYYCCYTVNLANYTCNDDDDDDDDDGSRRICDSMHDPVLMYVYCTYVRRERTEGEIVCFNRIQHCTTDATRNGGAYVDIAVQIYTKRVGGFWTGIY
jgi:hypothetical protein